MQPDILQIRGKILTSADVKHLQTLIRANPTANRTELSITISTAFGWRQPNGNVQDVACREILRRLEKKGLVALPPGRRPGGHPKKPWVAPAEVCGEDRPAEITGVLGCFPAVSLVEVATLADGRRWNEWIGRYHYLGWSKPVGRSMRYWITLEGREVGLIGFSSPSWKLACRDTDIGWDGPTRERNLQGIANNHRFLILPWVRIKYLASHVLSVAARRVAADWWNRYGVRLYLLESFVDPALYRGTCYKAANWRCVGESRGSSKSGNSYVYHGRVKEVYVYPLTKDFRERLRGMPV